MSLLWLLDRQDPEDEEGRLQLQVPEGGPVALFTSEAAARSYLEAKLTAEWDLAQCDSDDALKMLVDIAGVGEDGTEVIIDPHPADGSGRVMKIFEALVAMKGSKKP
jgi:hypothetical protein